MRKNLTTRRVRFETLEGRQLLAGGGWIFPPAPPVRMSVTEQSVAVADVVSGAEFVLGKEFLSALPAKNGRVNKGQLVGATLLPMDGSGDLSNLDWVQVWGDLSAGKVKTGWRKGDVCETLMGSARANEEGALEIQFYRKPWVSKTGLRLEYVAKAGRYLDSEATNIGAEMEVAWIKDLKGNFVSDDNIVYRGSGTLHTLESSTARIYQQQGKAFSSVSPHETWKLIEFNGWCDNSRFTTISFQIFNPGNIVPETFTLVEDTNWDGIGDKFWTGSIAMGDQITFDLGTEGVLDGNCWVTGYSAEHPVANNTFSMTLKSAKAVDLDSGRALSGIMINDNGAGQIQLWTTPSTTFALVDDPALVIFSGDTSGGKSTILTAYPGQEIVVASFTVRNREQTAVSFINTELILQNGNFQNAGLYTLWAYSDNGARVELSSGVVAQNGSAVEFDYNCSIAPGATVKFGVTAIVSESFAYPVMLQAQINPYKTYGTDSAGNIGIDRAFYWLGENPWYRFQNNPPENSDGGVGIAELQAQIAALMAQLNALQPAGGMG